jgi:hypothetical protein
MTDLSQCGPPAFVIRALGVGGLQMEGRPVSAKPPEGTTGYLYRREGDTITKYCAGVFRGGRWRNISGDELEHEPSHWLALS